MQDEPNAPTGRDWDGLERDALYALTDTSLPPVMSLDDLGRHIEESDPESIIRPLVNAGLLHRLNKRFVVATPAAYRWVQIVGHVV